MELEQLVGEARERELQPMPARERIMAATFGLAFVAATAAILAIVPPNRATSPLVLAALVAVGVISRRVPFEIGSVELYPDMLAIVPMVFLAPLPLVPLLVVASYLIARGPELVRGRTHPDRWLYPIGDALPTVAMVAVLAAAAPGPVSVAHGAAYALALGVYVMAVLAYGIAGDFVLGISPREAFVAIVQCLRIDAMLAPLGFMAAVVGSREPVLVIGVVPLMWLLRVFSNERRDRIAAAIELNQAYRGTVMVLSDVVEAEDNYTANHCRSVVELAAAVAEELGMDHRTRQELEIAALLHDVGKIAIPNEILNKPAKLTAEEFELMKTHTVEGQALLDRVGGRLAKVGAIVRSCHERWDGTGYPDGLAGDVIPVAARVVFCCDAYSAMTTDRPYRRAMSPDAALDELRRNSGTQFEPRVVEALHEVVARDSDVSDGLSYSDALRAVLAGQPAPALEASSYS